MKTKKTTHTPEPKTLDIKMTWTGTLQYLVALIQDGTLKGREVALKELRSMATVADAYDDLRKQRDDLLEAAKIGLAALMVGQEEGRTPVFSNAYDKEAYERLASAVRKAQGES